MLHAPVELSIRNSKLEISRLLVGPSPDSSPRASHAPPSSRSISVPTSTPLYPLVTSPTPSTTSQVSTATAPPNLYAQPERRARGPSNLAAGSLEPTVPPPGLNKRPPPDKPHASASPAKKQSKWTPEEDALIIQLRGAGMRWEEISRHLPGRSMTSARLHYQNYLEKKCPWDEEKSNKLARLYERYVLRFYYRFFAELIILQYYTIIFFNVLSFAYILTDFLIDLNKICGPSSPLNSGFHGGCVKRCIGV